jgi:uncharacterized damage-inducible protein DinB
MDPMAKAFRLGLDRSDEFIGYFTKGMEGDDWLKRPPGVPNPAIWTLGHLAFVRGRFLELLTGKKTYGDAWVPLFEIGCEPRDPREYPDVETCRAFLRVRIEDIRAYLETATREDLESPPCVPSRFFPTKAAALVHMTLHEAHHTGCLSLVRRMLGKEKVI